MKNLQQLIDKLKFEKSKALQQRESFMVKANECNEKANAFDFAIDKAEELLKNTENENGGKKDASNDGKPM